MVHSALDVTTRAILFFLAYGRVAALHILDPLEQDVESHYMPSPNAGYFAGPRSFSLNTSEIGAALFVLGESRRHVCSPSEVEAAEIRGKTLLVQWNFGLCSLEESYLRLVDAGARAIILLTAATTPGQTFLFRGGFASCQAAAKENVPLLVVSAGDGRKLKLLVESTPGDVHLLLEPDSNTWVLLAESFLYQLVFRWIVPLLNFAVVATAIYVGSVGFAWGSTRQVLAYLHLFLHCMVLLHALCKTYCTLAHNVPNLCYV